MNPSRTSEVLAAVAQACDRSWTLGDLAVRLGGHGFGLILLVLALPNAIPLPIPGVSTLTGPLLLFFAAQLMLGRQAIWLPASLARRGIRGERLAIFLRHAIPWLRRLECVVRPRVSVLGERGAVRFAAVLMVLLACLLALPIPLANLPLGIAATALALAVAERDGLAMLVAWGLSLLALAYFAALMAGYGWLLWQAAARVIAF